MALKPQAVVRWLNRWLWRVIGRLAFNHISVIDVQHLPTTGPVLLVATHRNGALDAASYRAAVPYAVPMVSAQLHRMPLGRFLFQGIAVARGKDRDRGITVDNEQSLQACVALLQAGGQLFVMPEGTSTLGPQPLPYHRGAARIARAVMDAGVVPVIVPLAVHYEDPTRWQSRVEVLVGQPITPRLEDKVAELHSRITQGLDAVGARFSDADNQRKAEALAYAMTLGTDVSYARALKSFEAGIPQDLDQALQQLQQLAWREQLALHQGVPLIPVGPWARYAVYWMLLAPVLLFFTLINLPVLVIGHLASRTLPDAPNVIAFWRMVAGVPAGMAWAVFASLFMDVLAGAPGVAGYWGVTLGGLWAWYRFRKLSIALCNAIFHAKARPALLQAYRHLRDRNHA